MSNLQIDQEVHLQDIEKNHGLLKKLFIPYLIEEISQAY